MSVAPLLAFTVSAMTSSPAVSCVLDAEQREKKTLLFNALYTRPHMPTLSVVNRPLAGRGLTSALTLAGKSNRLGLRSYLHYILLRTHQKLNS